MFNPELRELYSDNVIVELEKLAEDFKAKGIECWVYGLKDMYGIKAPDTVFYDATDMSIWTQVFEMQQRYKEKLSPEEDEKFGMLHPIASRSNWIPELIKSSKKLWL